MYLISEQFILQSQSLVGYNNHINQRATTEEMKLTASLPKASPPFLLLPCSLAAFRPSSSKPLV